MTELTEKIYIDRTELDHRETSAELRGLSKGILIGGLIMAACIGFAALMQGAI